MGEKNLWLLGDASALLACLMHLVDGAFPLLHLRDFKMLRQLTISCPPPPPQFLQAVDSISSIVAIT
jgi:hypothetical protein